LWSSQWQITGFSRIRGSNSDIGYPKLFIGGAVGRQDKPAAPTVNNFVAASGATVDSGWLSIAISCIHRNVFPHRRARSFKQ